VKIHILKIGFHNVKKNVLKEWDKEYGRKKNE